MVWSRRAGVGLPGPTERVVTDNTYGVGVTVGAADGFHTCDGSQFTLRVLEPFSESVSQLN